MADDKIYTNVGHATAYSYAKSKGYTGTEDEFAEELARVAENAQAVREDREYVDATVEGFVQTTVPAAVQSVTSEGTTQIGNVQTAGTTQVGNVQDEGTTQVGRVTAEGTTQVGLVTAEGTTQKNAVTAKGQEVIESIPSDYTELTEDVEDLKSSISDVNDYALNAYATDTASGAIATFADGAEDIPIKSLSVAIEPVQDLHGQDAPYPAGGGKNLLDFRTKASGTDNGITYTNNDGVITVNGTASGYSYYQSKTFELPAGTYVVNGRPSGSNAALIVYNANTSSGIANPSAGNEATFTLSETTPIYARIAIGDATETNKVFYPMIRLATETDATFAPYSNICPISGHTSANVTRTGINVWDEEWELGTLSTVTGEPVANAGQIRAKNYIPVVGGETYQMVTTTTPDGVWMFFYDSDKNVIADELPDLGGKASNARKAYNNISIPMPSNCSYVRFYFQQIYGTTYNNDTGINYPSTDTSYHSYQGTTYPITFPSGTGTVYGGNITVNQDGSGSLVVDRAMLTASDDENWRYDVAGGNYSYVYYRGLIISTDITKLICNIAPTVSNSTDLGVTRSGGGNIQLYVNALGITSLDTWKSYIPNNTVEFVYPFATPITISLTAPQIITLLGTNNIWSDTNGDVSVTYRADTALYISKKIAEALNA